MVNGILAGAIGGLAATWTMSKAQRLWTKAAGGAVPDSAADEHDARDWQERTEGQNSNELAAQALASMLLDRRLTRGELAIAAASIHYMFGTVVGAFYGAYVQQRGGHGLAAGMAMGITLWVTADEIAMPVLGLSRPTTGRPLEMHLQSLTAHLVYGVTAEAIRQRVHATSSRVTRAGGRQLRSRESA
jgi:hypothetical protein